ncbi:hypothetical protein AKJ09_10045 [Labilithrix luteola]|uniref:DUF4833 domain-containing protein n=1 Tax=Labilithrix luteola TaxID=1391654 RepID=A0A0K1QCJ7_9BACT|nr:DUF4833 domain-containing protein [Labilithrix luteola]AKV03382.1 hypothetical protein AKJ09_10045 [Labilithrix luteola]
MSGRVRGPGTRRSRHITRRSFVLGGIGLAILARAPSAWAVLKTTQTLFRIDRSKNANIVQYDAVLGTPTELDKDTPIIGYWLRRAEDGRRQEFSSLDKMAYGFKVEREKGANAWTLRLNASTDRPIRVFYWNGRWVAQMIIAGATAVLDHLYVASDEGGVMPKVKYVDAFGTEMSTGKKVTERLKS